MSLFFNRGSGGGAGSGAGGGAGGGNGIRRSLRNIEKNNILSMTDLHDCVNDFSSRRADGSGGGNGVRSDLLYYPFSKDKKYVVDLQTRKQMLQTASRYKNEKSFIVMKWIMKPVLVGNKDDLRILLRRSSRFEERCLDDNYQGVHKAMILKIIDDWIYEGLHLLRCDDISVLCNY